MGSVYTDRQYIYGRHALFRQDLKLRLLLQRLQGEVFLFMDMCGSLLATLRL